VITFAEGAVDPDRWAVLENVIAFRSVPSSNALGRELIELYFEEDQNLRTTVLLAESQPEAYGRNGRKWSAPEGRVRVWRAVVSDCLERDPAAGGQPLHA